MNRAQSRVLHRNEAAQMAVDLGDAIENVIMLAGEMTDTDKVLAVDTLIILQSKRNILQGELAYTDCEGAEREVETLKQAASQKSGAQ